MSRQLSSATSKSISLQAKTAVRLFERSVFTRTVALFFAVQLLLLVAPALARAQTIQYTQNMPEFTQRSVMRVDPTTLGLGFEVPIANYKGRAGLSVPISLSYSSKVWRIDITDSFLSQLELPQTRSYPRYSEWAKAGWTTSADLPIVEWVGHQQLFNANGLPECESCGEHTEVYINRILIHMPGGVSHELRISDTPVSSLTYEGVYYAVDGSNLRYEAASFTDGTLFMPDGSRYILNYSTNSFQLIDRNGNTLIYDRPNKRWTDTQGRTFDIPLPATPAATTYTYNLPSATGTPAPYSLRWSTLQAALTNPNDQLRYDSNMTPSGPGDWFQERGPALFVGNAADRVYGQWEIFNPIVLAEITLRNGKSYQFTYNIWGEITKVVYPTGAYERFEHGPVDGVSFLLAPFTQGNRGVINRWLSATGSAADEVQWSYSAVNDEHCLTVTITGPDNTTQHLITALTSTSGNAFGYSIPTLGTEYEERTFAPGPGGAMLRRTLTKWGTPGAAPGWLAGTRNPRVIQKTEIMLDPVSENALASTSTMEYDDDSNNIASHHFDYVSLSQSSAQTSPLDSITSGTLLRTDEVTYLVNDPNVSQSVRDAYRARNMVTLSTSARIKQGTNLVAQSSVSYDETGLQSCAGLIYWTNPGSGVPRGNATSVRRWLNTTDSWVETHAVYDQAGNLVSTTDVLGRTTTTSFLDSFSDNQDRHTYAYPTQVTTAVPDPSGVHGSAVGMTTTMKYDFNTGLTVSNTDINGRTTSFEYNDSLNRLKKVNRPNGGWTSMEYGDDAGNLFVRTQVLQQSTPTQQVTDSYQYFDAFARPVRSYVYDGTAGTPWSVTESKYDSLGRVSEVSKPYRVANVGDTGTTSWTTMAYDALSRATSVTTPGGAVVTTSYAGTKSLVTDQAGKKRLTKTNSLGQLSDVWEITPADSWTESVSFNGQTLTGYHTAYVYDLLNNLLTVTQGAQPSRSFAFDSLNRMTTALNPESGTISYQYDAAGNVKVKTDSRNASTHYEYDALNRLTRRWYNGSNQFGQLVNNVPALPSGVAVSDESNYYYDAALPATAPLNFVNGYSMGRLVAATYGTGNNGDYYGYNSVGQINVKVQQTAGINYQIGPIVYNLAGSLISQVYPSGRSVANTYDAAGRTTSVVGNLGDNATRDYATGIAYDAAGRLAQERFGTATPIYSKLLYNTRGQVAEILAATTGNDTAWNRGKIVNDYSDQCSGAACNGTDNNGNLRKQTVYVPNNDQNTNPVSWYQQFDYDALNRLERVHEYTGNTSLDWQQQFVYDRFGNRSISASGTTQLAGINRMQAAVVSNTTTNRLYAPGETEANHPLMNYDAAGNQTKDYYSDPNNLDFDRTYDCENRMKTSTAVGGSQTAVYTYDADGRRVRRNINNVETWQLYGVSGELLAEYAQNALPSAPQKEYGYRNGQLLITAEASGGVPLSLAAGPASNNPSSNVALSWSAVSGATNYRVERKDASTNWAAVGTTASNSFSDTGAVLGTPYLYRICTANAGGACTSSYSNAALGSRFNFPTDPVIISNADNPGGSNLTSMKLEHITELRTAINAVRQLAGLGTASWNHTTLTRYVSPISKDDVTDLRTALNQALTQLGILASTYDDPTLAGAPTGTSIKATHIRQLRERATGSSAFRLQPVSATASTSHSSPYDPSHAIDNNASTLWSAGAMAPQWIQLDLGQLSTVSKVRLLVDQYPAGHTTHQVYGGPTTGNLTLLGTLDGNTSLGDWLELNSTATDIRYLKVQTTASPSWVGWAEIEVYGSATASPAQIRWLLADQLGTPRMIFDQSGSLATVSRHDYLPFGEQLPGTVGLRPQAGGYGIDDGTRQKFAQKERDTETELDFSMNRYYSNVQGRFTSVDPQNAGAHPGNPQTWNGYSYGLNQPMLYSDPDGLRVRVCGTDGQCTDDDTDLTDEQWNSWFYRDSSIKLSGGRIYKNGVFIGTYQQLSCDSCYYDIFAMGREIKRKDPGGRAVRLYAKAAVVALTLPGAAPGWIAIGVFEVMVPVYNEPDEDAFGATIKYDRQYAVEQAWKQEAELVRRTGKGTRAWTPDELRQLRDVGKVAGYEGHHINSVKGNEGNRELIRNPNNIEFVKAGKAEHLGRHGGNTRNPTTGPLIKRR